MKTKDLLKYFLFDFNVLTLVSPDECGKSFETQIMDTFNCSYKDIFLTCSIMYPGDYLETHSYIGLEPDFIVIVDDVICYFTLIEEE